MTSNGSTISQLTTLFNSLVSLHLLTDPTKMAAKSIVAGLTTKHLTGMSLSPALVSLSRQYDVSLPLTKYYQLVEDMRERCAHVTRWTLGCGHVGDSKAFPFPLVCQYLTICCAYIEEYLVMKLNNYTFYVATMDRSPAAWEEDSTFSSCVIYKTS